jgi:DNA helicase II / ATP-dependent DNA helicase PcrA
VTDSPTVEQDPELERVVHEEHQCLDRILRHVEQKQKEPVVRRETDYDTQLLQLRDEIAAARMEDVPPLLEQMERLQGIASRQRLLVQGTVDSRSPYFGRMVLSEGERTREVLIGRSTYLDAASGIRIVDWRDAPVSRLYYRCAEGDVYEEVFGGREIEGEVLVRRSLTIVETRLRRIVTPQGTFIKPENGEWRRGGASIKLSGGEGSAVRADQHHGPRKLGVGDDGIAGEDKHLREITALIDQRQFELITKPDSGLVVIQGGAGSGKTTIGLHRLAYLAFNDARRFRPDRMLVIVFNEALARYISQVLPALDVRGVAVKTYESWSSKLRQQLVTQLPARYCDDTPPVVSRFKKNPALRHVIVRYCAELATELEQSVIGAVTSNPELSADVSAAWAGTANKPLAHRVHGLKRWLERNSSKLSPSERHGLGRQIERALYRTQDLVSSWVDILTDRERIVSVFRSHDTMATGERELSRALAWCRQRCSLMLAEVEPDDVEAPPARDTQRPKGRGSSPPNERQPREGESQRARESRARESEREKDAGDDDEYGAVDGRALEEQASLDPEDDTLLLLLWQHLRGAILQPGTQEALVYEHVLIDEAQDLSPLELSVVMRCVSGGQSITLSGDVAQRLYMDNGFLGWNAALGELGFAHVAIEPLQVSYRSTAEIIDFAREVLGPLAPEVAPQATRRGATVELFRFADNGEAVGFLAEALKELIEYEPRASVAVISRHPEQADIFYQGLARAEVPKCRRIAHQDFPFKPGIDVTDVRQVKGLEFDYVILVEVSHATYGVDDEARHLLHIAATRAAHQLWVLTSGQPSSLLPQELRERSY